MLVESCWFKRWGFQGGTDWVGGEVLFIYVELIAKHHQLEGENNLFFSISLGSTDMRV